MFGGISRWLTKTAAAMLAGLAAILSTVRVAFGTSTDTSLPSGYSELLKLAHEKVQVATQPGAFGNGVPSLSGVDPMTVFALAGLAVGAAIAVIIAAKEVAPALGRRAIVAQ